MKVLLYCFHFIQINYYIELYIKLITTPDKEADSDIEKDVLRTFPNTTMFQEPSSSGKNKLFNVLKAYSQHDIKVGYCQGNILVAVL